MARGKLRAGIVVACLLAGLTMIAPASADTGNFMIGTLDTGVPTTCAVTGTGFVGQTPNVSNVPYSYDGLTAGRWSCARAVYAFMWHHARGDYGTDGSLSQKLTALMLTGRPDMRDPYQVLVNDTFVSEPLLAALSHTAGPANGPIGPFDNETAPGPSTGLGNCRLSSKYLQIICNDDPNGSFMARDANGYPWPSSTNPAYIPLDGILSQNGGTTYGSVFLLNGYAPGDDRVLHHEQVHSQQWQQYGWDFANRYITDAVNSQGNGVYYYWVYGKVQGVTVPAPQPAPCFNGFERQAGFQDGNYALRDAAHDGTTNTSSVLYVPPNKPYPTGWTDTLNAMDWRGSGAPAYYCPSTW